MPLAVTTPNLDQCLGRFDFETCIRVKIQYPTDGVQERGNQRSAVYIISGLVLLKRKSAEPAEARVFAFNRAKRAETEGLKRFLRYNMKCLQKLDLVKGCITILTVCSL